MKRWLRMKGGYRSLKALVGENHLERLLRPPPTFQLIPALLRTDADVVTTFSWGYPQAYHAYLARKLKRFRLVGIPLFHTAEGRGRQPIYQKMIAQCDAIIANTRHEADFALARGAKAAAVGGVGIWPQDYAQRDGNAVRQKYGLGDAPVVGFVGRADVPKGAADVLTAMKSVWRWNPSARLVIAGPRIDENGRFAPYLRSLTPEEEARVVRIHEFPEEEKASLFDAFDVFAMPSIADSFGIAYLEAWMCNKPVIGANIGSTRCVIDDGVDGLLVEPGDTDTLASHIVGLLKDPQRRACMGAAGHQKTLQHHTWDKVTDRVEKVYMVLNRLDSLQ